MKQLRFIKSNAGQTVDGYLRILGRYLYFKYTDSSQAKQVLEEFKKKGLTILEGKGWIRVDLIGKNEVVKLGEIEIDTNEDTIETIENKLYAFYKDQYIKLGFNIQEMQNEEPN